MQHCTRGTECQLFLTIVLFYGALIIFHLTYKFKNIAWLISLLVCFKLPIRRTSFQFQECFIGLS